jgi:solute:Na+ symporter, SSS family
VLMIVIGVGTAYAKVTNPDFRIIPFVLGIAGLFLGPMLGVFLVGMLTRRRGSDAGNMLAITVSLVAMVFISGQHIALMNMIHPVAMGRAPIYRLPEWMLVVSWPWYATFGAAITFALAVCFSTPIEVLDAAERKVGEASESANVPMSLRERVAGSAGAKGK